MTLIEFVPNPSFKPPAPAIRVGSVVESDRVRYVIVDFNPKCEYADSRTAPRHGLSSVRINSVKPLPLRVSGITEQGEWEYAPIDPLPQEFSWEQYPPRAGMVVELDAESCVDRLRLLFLHGNDCIVFNKMGSCQGSGNLRITKQQYRPRPDQMPRFVEEQR